MTTDVHAPHVDLSHAAMMRRAERTCEGCADQRRRLAQSLADPMLGLCEVVCTLNVVFVIANAAVVAEVM